MKRHYDFIVKSINEIVCNVFDVDEISKKTRERQYVDAKYAAMYWLKNNTDLSYHKIGLYYNIDHATVVYSLKRTVKIIETDNWYRLKMNKIMDNATSIRSLVYEPEYSI